MFDRSIRGSIGSIILLAVFVGLAARSTLAQQIAPPQPDAALSAAPSLQAGSITGQVRDVGGTAVPGAHVVLWMEGTAKQRLVSTDAEGRFSFTAVPPGRFTLTISETNLETQTVPGMLHPGEAWQAPPIAMRIATASASVEVTLPKDEVAEVQVQLEEKQRVLGVVPNFFVTYQTKPAPLNAREKFGLAMHGVADPTAFLGSGIVAGVEQANNTLPGYGQGAAGYGKRFGAAYANGASATLLRGAIFPSLLRQDPRFYFKADGSVWARTRYALATAVITHGDNGRWQPNYSGILGNLSAGALTNLYFPAGSRNGAAVTFENGLLTTAGVGVGHLLQEFVFVHMTTHRK